MSPGSGFRHVLVLGAADAHQLAEALADAGGRVQDPGVGVHRAREDPEDREGAGVAVHHGLEHQGAEGCRRVGRDLELAAAVDGARPARRTLQRRGQPLDHRAQEGRDALQRRGRAAQHREDLAGANGRHEAPRHFLVGQRAFLQVLLDQRVVALGHGLGDVVARRGGGLAEVLGHRALAARAQRHAAEHVHHAFEAPLGADRERDEHGTRALELGEGGQGSVEIGPLAVHPVHEGHGGKALSARRAPHRVGADLHAVHGRDDQHGAVESGQADLALAAEVRVARRVDQGDDVIAVVEAEDVGGERVTALLLLGPVVEQRAAVVHAAERLGGAGRVQQALGHGGLAVPRVPHQGEAPFRGHIRSTHGITSPCAEPPARDGSSRRAGAGPRG